LASWKNKVLIWIFFKKKNFKSLLIDIKIIKIFLDSENFIKMIQKMLKKQIFTLG